MDQKVAKRNFIIIVYELLKKETSQKVHLTATDIENRIYDQYGIKLNRKTTYRIMKDLIAFGADIKHDTNGYYLDTRALSDEDLTLLIDGISSLADVSVDYVYEVAEKLYDIAGKPIKDVEYFEYNGKDPGDDERCFWPDDNTIKQLKIINEAKRKKKKLLYYNTDPFPSILLDKISEEELQTLKEKNEKFEFFINPYYVFRNSENENYLLFYFILNKKIIRGAVSIGSLIQLEISVSNEWMDKVDTIELFKDFDSKNFTNANEYREGLKKSRVEFIMKKSDWLTLDAIEDYGTLSQRPVNNETVYVLIYPHKNEEKLINEFISYSDNLKVLPGNSIYDTIFASAKNLADTYLK